MHWVKHISGWLLISAMLSAGYAQSPLEKLVKTEAADKAAPTPLAALSNALVQVTREIEQAETNNLFQAQADKLRQIKSLIEEHLAVNLDLRKDPNPGTRDLPEIPALTEITPPYPLSLLDALRQAHRSRERTLQNLQKLAEATESELERTRKQQQTREREYRLLAESKEPIPDRKARLGQLKLDARVAEQQSGLNQARLHQVRASIVAVKAEQETVEEQLTVVGRRVKFPKSLYSDYLLKIDQREADIKARLTVVNLEIQRAEARRADPETSIPQIRLLRREVETLEERLQFAAESRQVWKRRFSLFTEKVGAEIRNTWRDEARQQEEELGRLLRLRLIQYDEATAATRDEADQEKKAATPRSQLVTLLDGSVTALQRLIDLNQNLLEDHELLYGSPTFGANLWNHIRKYSYNLWNLELKNIDDRPITVKKLVYALLLILIGIKVVRILSHSLVSRVLGKFKVEESSISSISTLVFYLLALIVVVTALGVANIPLTLFTLLGGALAIGVGFGSQAIINNFISGLIILVERPIRKGDMVEVGSTHGRVERVGLRCTQIRTFQNVDIMVPNSAFLENNVVNLTLSDDRYKAELFVGVVYGAPTQRVKALMLQAATEHEKVLEQPAPEVMFMDFGDNALIFRLYAWVRMRSPSDRDRVLSDMRFRIDELFRAEDLVIAFPQRDVHLDTLSPLEIRLTGQSPGGEDA